MAKKSVKKENGKTEKNPGFSNEIYAYALSNVIEFGKTDVSRILPKLFQHGLKKSQISNVLPLIQEIVKDVNSWSEEERKIEFEKYKEFIPERVVEDREELPDLPGIKNGKYKGRRPVFRIAPFPSGALHLGHAKTFLLNAMYAEKYKGKLILVMDDTIGSAKKPLDKEAYKLIQDGLKWLGIKYDKKITYKSDRIDTYYKYAKDFIKKDFAYVDHSTQDEMRKMREKGMESGHRKLPPKIQIERWKEMFSMPEGHATLRIKTDIKHPNPAFRDRVLFKISDREHPKVKKKYRIWPTLEMSWAIDDHLLGMTHIIRGSDLQMESEMERYVWGKLGWKSPEIVHTGNVRIDFSESGGAKISKSKSKEEVASGKYVGWDDPRTWSPQSLRRRGILPEAVREFVKEIGLNKQDITVPVDNLYAINRRLVDSEANRYFFVPNPVEIKIGKAPKWKSVEMENHPDKPEKREVKVSNPLFVTSADFEKLKGKEARLLHLFNVNLNDQSEVTSVDNKNIPKIHWVSAKDNEKVQVLMPDGSYTEGVAESAIKKMKKDEVIQFERFGFCRYDRMEKGKRIFWFAHK